MSLTSEDLLAISDLLDNKLRPVKDEIREIKKDMVGINLHLENVTDKNINILAENHLTLIDKLNQAIKITDKTLIYEVQVNLLNSKVDKLEKELADIKCKIA